MEHSVMISPWFLAVDYTQQLLPCPVLGMSSKHSYRSLYTPRESLRWVRLTSKSDLNNTTKCDQIYSNDCHKFGHT
jgi:hypothetical protein